MKRKSHTSGTHQHVTPPSFSKKQKRQSMKMLNTSLLHQTFEGNIENIKNLISAGANPSAVNSAKQSPLYIAAACGYEKIVELLSIWCHLQHVPGPLDSYPQHIAADNGHVATLKILCETPLSPCDQKTTEGRTPLYMASQSNQGTCVKYLLSCTNANPLEHDINQVTPLAMACQLGSIHAVRALLLYVDDNTRQNMLNAKDCSGYTPLHTAVWAGKTTIVQMLVTAGADVNARNHSNQIPGDLTSVVTIQLILSRNAPLYMQYVPEHQGTTGTGTISKEEVNGVWEAAGTTYNLLS